MPKDKHIPKKPPQEAMSRVAPCPSKQELERPVGGRCEIKCSAYNALTVLFSHRHGGRLTRFQLNSVGVAIEDVMQLNRNVEPQFDGERSAKELGKQNCAAIEREPATPKHGREREAMRATLPLQRNRMPTAPCFELEKEAHSSRKHYPSYEEI